MIAGAIAEPSMSASDWVAKMTLAFFLRSVFSAFPELFGKAAVIEGEPAFVDDEQVERPSSRSPMRWKR